MIRAFRTTFMCRSRETSGARYWPATRWSSNCVNGNPATPIPKARKLDLSRGSGHPDAARSFKQRIVLAQAERGSFDQMCRISRFSRGPRVEQEVLLNGDSFSETVRKSRGPGNSEPQTSGSHRADAPPGPRTRSTHSPAAFQGGFTRPGFSGNKNSVG